MKDYLNLFFKGMGMGAANVIPGVSGGTIALITGIFERLIHAIKSFNFTAVRLLFSGKFKDFAKHIDLMFLFPVFLGIAISIISIARLFGYLFDSFPTYIWAYFFGLILGSVYFVGKTISKWSVSVILLFIIGTAVAVSISYLNPATEDDSFIYLIICGVIAACSMILPGLSGSFVLILLGNYQLVMIDAVNNMSISILLPVVIGAGVGLIAFSHFLSWIFLKYKDQTIGILTGFILGSLGILWPWKESFDKFGKIIPTNKFGAFTNNAGEIITDIKVFEYKQIIPEFNIQFAWVIALLILGIVSIWIIEKVANKTEKDN